MKTKIFNQETCPKFSHSQGTINVHVSGQISFNTKALEILSITTKSKFQFVQDEENPTNWYIEVIDNAKGFSINFSGTRASIFNRALVGRILQSLNLGTNKKFILSPALFEGKYFPIITHSRK